MVQNTASDVQTPPYRQTAFEIMLGIHQERVSAARRGGGLQREPADG